MTIDLEAEYDNRARVPEHPGIIAGWARGAAAYRARVAERMSVIDFGPTPRQHIDIFAPEKPNPDALPVLFIHGGYWQALDPSHFSHMAAGLNAHGVTVGVAGYDLCPNVSMGEIIAQMRAAALALRQRCGKPLVACGHSAGGHLTACLAATDWAGEQVIAGGLAISGLFELEPLVPTSVNIKLGLDIALAREFSPRLWRPPRDMVFEAWVGGDESGEYLRQTATIDAIWGAAGNATLAVTVEGANHFTVIAGLAEAGNAMTLRLKEMARG
jgi:arylformamidase